MSHAATKWAFDQPEAMPDMKPAEWAVLVILADCHNPVHGCFPSQDYICRRTNLSERAVRDHLARLRERGLINWEAAREAGKRGSNRYFLACEEGFQPPQQPADSAGSETTVSTGRNEHFQPADSDSFNRQNLPPNLVREPVRESLSCADARESASEPEGEREDLQDWTAEQRERAFKRFAPTWPSWLSSSEAAARKAWNALDRHEAETAAARAVDYAEAVKGEGKSYICALQTYLVEKRWERLGEAAALAAAPQFVAPFGKGWMALRLHWLTSLPKRAWHPTVAQRALIETGRGHLLDANRRYGEHPEVQALDTEASRNVDARAPAGFDAEAGAGYVRIRRGSDEWQAWQDWHHAQGWPWIDPPEHVQFVYVPAALPDRMAKTESEAAA